ncbi:hypothetical protein OIU77_004857 [Salix suchowensis]|uniref:PGG domain-containing protein n=1 Tax=Salix suchowensis TaxID=1278906 RepID=A0ABQ9AVT6_9ROSI|nr:hypothetical protein OIU77_004857 [Salix suchowensis]
MASIAINIDENSIPREHKASSMIDSQLHECLRQDSIEAFKSLVQTHFAEELVTPCGNTRLHVAVSYGSDKIIAYLAEEFPSLITTQNSQEDTILHLAAREGKDRDIIKSLVESNPCLMRKTNTKGNTPLHDAVIKASKDPEVAYYNNKNGRSPLYLAVEKGNRNGILDDLLKSGSSIPIKREDGDALPKGKSPVHAAIEQRNRDILEKIEKAKPELLRLTDEELGNSLHYASSIESLVNEMDEDGNTPLHLAAGSGKSVAAFVLVRDIRVDSSIVNNENLTPYYLAEQQSKSAEEKFDKANEMDGQDNSKDVEYGMKNSTTENSTDWTSSERKQDKAKRDTEKASPKDEGLINYFGVVTTLSILYFYARPKKSLRDYFTVTPGLISQGKEESKNRIGNLLVVAVLVAGVTFAGAVQLPQLRDNNNSREQHHESNSIITASHYSSYENHLYGYLLLDVGALSASMVAALILLWANFNDARFILLAVQFAGFMVFWAIIMMFGAFFLSVRIALLGSSEVWLSIAITVVAVVFFVVQAFLFLPWIIPRPVNQIIQRILLHYINYLSFFTLFYCWRWLTEKLPELPDLKKKLQNTREQREK